MDALSFLKEAGASEAARVAGDAGTNIAYFRQIAYGHRRPSVELAQRLVSASSGRLDFERLLLAKKPKPGVDRREAA